MSTTRVLPDNIPTDAEIVEGIRSVMPGLKLYRPSPDWWSFTFGGQDEWMPPDLPGEPMVEHPTKRNKDGSPLMVKANGILEVKDRYGAQLDEKTKKPSGYGPTKGEDAYSIVKFALTNHQQHGLTMLHEVETDEKRKKKALAMFLQFQRQWAEAQVAARAKYVKNFKALSKNAHVEPRDQSPLQKLAQEILDELMDKGTKSYKYACESRCYATNDLEKFERHLRLRHPKEFELWQADNSVEPAGALNAAERTQKMAGAVGKPAAKKKAAGKKTA